MDSDFFADLFSPHPAHGTFRRYAGTRKALFIDSRKEPDSFLLATNFLLHPSQTANFSTTGSADQIALAMPALIANHQVEVVLVGSRTAFQTFTARTELIGFTGMLERACYKDKECLLSSMEGLDDEVEECSQLLQPFVNAGRTAVVVSVVGTDYYVLCFNFKWEDGDSHNLKSSRSFPQLCDGVVQFIVANTGISQFLFPEPYTFRRFCETPQLEQYRPLFRFLDKNEGAISYVRAREILHDGDAIRGNDATKTPSRERTLEGSGLFPWLGRFAKKYASRSVAEVEAPASATRTLETSAIGFYFVARDSDDPAAHRAVVDFLEEVPEGTRGTRALPFAQMAAAIALKKLGKLSDARGMIDQALESAGAAHPYFNQALEEKVDILVELGVNERIVDEIGEPNIETIFEWASAHPAKATPLLQSMADRYPDNGNCWTALGAALSKTGQERDAIEAYRKRLELDPFDSNAFVSLGDLLDQQDDAGFALSVVDEILSRLPDNAQGEDEATRAERKIPDGIESVMRFKSDLLETKLKIYEKVGDVDSRLRICDELIDHYETLNLKETARHQTQPGHTPDDKYARAIARRAETYRLQGNHAAALADFDRAIELDDKYAWAIASRGQVFQKSGNYRAALMDFDRAIELNGEWAWAIGQRANTYRLMGNHAAALADFDRVIELDKEYAWAIASRGQVYQESGNYPAAVVDFDRAIELNGESAWAIAQRAETYRLMGDHAAALTEFNRAIELDNEYTWAIASRGQVYQASGNYPAALADFNRAIELDNEYAWAIASRGQVYQASGNYPAALADFDRAIELNNNWAWALANRGQTYQASGNYTAALADFDQAIELDDKYAWAIGQRAKTYRLMGNHAAALADFDRAIELDDKYAWAIASRGQAFRESGNYPAALADFDRAIELDDKDAWSFAQRAETYRLLGNHAAALADFGRAIELDDKYAWAIASRGQIYQESGNYPAALVDFERVLRVDPDDWYEYLQGLTQLAIDRSAAEASFTRAIQRASDKYKVDCLDWRNTLNLIVYNLAAGNVHEAERVLEDVLSKTPSRRAVRDAITDLDNFLKFFEGHLAAQSIRDRLAQHLERNCQ